MGRPGRPKEFGAVAAFEKRHRHLIGARLIADFGMNHQQRGIRSRIALVDENERRRTYIAPVAVKDRFARCSDQRMKAVVVRCYGSPDVLGLEEIAKPAPADDQVLVRVHAASVNPKDWRLMRGSPYVLRMPDGVGTPKRTRIGTDFAGTVEAVGKNVTRFKPGDEVFGGTTGAGGVCRQTRG